MSGFNFFVNGTTYSLILHDPRNRMSEMVDTDERATYLIVINDTLRFIREALTTPYQDGYDVLLAIVGIPLYPVFDTVLNIILAGLAVYNMLHGLLTLNQQEFTVGATQITAALFKELLSFVLPTISLIHRAIATIGEQEGKESLLGEMVSQVARAYTVFLDQKIISLCNLTHNTKQDEALKPTKEETQYRTLSC